jgi:hypothetical protein
LKTPEWLIEPLLFNKIESDGGIESVVPQVRALNDI